MSDSANTPAPAPVAPLPVEPVLSDDGDGMVTAEQVVAALSKQGTTEETPGDTPTEEGTKESPKEEAPKDAIQKGSELAAKVRQAAYRSRASAQEAEQLRRHNAQAQARIEHLQAENQKAQQLQQQLTTDPYAALKRLGMTDEDLAKRAIQEGTPEAAIDQIRRELAAERQKREHLEAKIQGEKTQVVVRQAEVSFLQESAKDTYPLLSETPEKVVLALAKTAVKDWVDEGYDASEVTDEEMCRFLEANLAKGRRSKKPPVEGSPKTETKEVPKAKKTLTNSLATSKFAMPANFDDLAKDEQYKALGAMLDASRK